LVRGRLSNCDACLFNLRDLFSICFILARAWSQKDAMTPTLSPSRNPFLTFFSRPRTSLGLNLFLLRGSLLRPPLKILTGLLVLVFSLSQAAAAAPSIRNRAFTLGESPSPPQTFFSCGLNPRSCWRLAHPRIIVLTFLPLARLTDSRHESLVFLYSFFRYPSRPRLVCSGSPEVVFCEVFPVALRILALSVLYLPAS